MNKNEKIYIAGHRGMAGSAILRKLTEEGYHNFALRTSAQMDCRNQQAVNDFFEKEKPAFVFIAAAKVGGIVANNTFRAEFIYDNLMIESNIIHAAYKHGVKKLLFLGSSCIYPKFAPQPLKEEYLLTGLLEETNEPYAIAKIAGIKLCDAYRSQYNCNFISVMPANVYGPNDNYHPQNSHVIPALIKKFDEAKNENKESVEVWGSGKPMREFLYVDDLADASYFLMLNYNEGGFLNIGTGKDITIHDLAMMIKKVVGFEGNIHFNTEKPDGTPRKVLDISKISSSGWLPKTDLLTGLKLAYMDYKQHNTSDIKII